MVYRYVGQIYVRDPTYTWDVKVAVDYTWKVFYVILNGLNVPIMHVRHLRLYILDTILHHP